MAASGVESSQQEPGHAVLGVLGVIGAARAGLDARLIEAARIVVATTGAALLADKGFASVEELTDAQRRAWRSEAKRAACAEVEGTLGLGVVEARHLVGVACAPRGVRTPVLGALDRGDVTWGMVRDFWRRCARLSPDDASLVAESLFGTEAATAAPERLTPDDLLRDTPWHAADYRAALEREATRAEGVDVQAERDRRREAYRQRRASVVVDADGTATLSVTGPLIAVVAAHSRIERAARLLRKHGDLRTLDQLRADVTAALLVHGQLPLPDTADDASGWRDLQVPDLHRIARVVTGMPTVQLQVVLPWDTLTGSPACTHAGLDERSGREVAHLLGAHPAALTPGHARELALMPDTTLSRLLCDPADGRLVERTLTTYRPDADMRRQVLAADVHSRAPGTQHPGTTCELDHVSPWAGRTRRGSRWAARRPRPTSSPSASGRTSSRRSAGPPPGSTTSAT
ncbi:hypothetical protein [uncultured Serinicoccus sp.]|uniref:hypothetical protein n=1 Tax=uncultured Serinicoccus sp. TaxID=735514 RepID=UPI00262475C6|nr:hypothetical protein [uncultured Serinicoccus sp.]